MAPVTLYLFIFADGFTFVNLLDGMIQYAYTDQEKPYSVTIKEDIENLYELPEELDDFAFLQYATEVSAWRI